MEDAFANQYRMGLFGGERLEDRHSPSFLFWFPLGFFERSGHPFFFFALFAGVGFFVFGLLLLLCEFERG